MKYRQLGASDLQVPVISLGSWLTYSGGVEKRQAIACVHKALDLGINFFDTANVYGRGAAESVLGEALHGIDRTSYMLATKVFFAMSDTDRGLSRAQIVKQLDASLKRLGTDYIDLYQCHRFDEETPLDETMEALTAAVRQGKTRYIGFSEWPLDKIEAAAKMPGVARFVSSSAAIFDALALSARRDFSLLRRARHWPDRLVAARPGRADRQIQTGCTAAGRVQGRSCVNGRDAAETVAEGSCADGRAKGEAYRRKRNGLEFIPVRACLGFAQAGGVLGNHRGKPSRTSDGECCGSGSRGGAGAFRAGRGNPGTVPAPPLAGLFASSKACSRTSRSGIPVVSEGTFF